ncbi:uncharacterized protein C7orf31 homolog [Protopterus annectens]|uniref:uncharacterized protein C7orf31 homolog n=1 Tax=Protopterus annectens TaxID=7888 RepID=UPI001CFAEDEE|nr:uncharacterized protein C7orf31 homolog [Protopterus annectens]
MESEGLKGLSYYYHETQGADILSRTLESTELLTPLQINQRPTVSQERYQQYIQHVPKIPKMPWGREREYGGRGSVSLPDEHRPKVEPPTLVAKEHLHLGYGGDPWPRGVPVEQYYDVTHLKRSNLRVSDQLLPNPPDTSMNEKQIFRPFPAEHPYHSHIPKFALFPNFKSPDDPETGVQACDSEPVHSNIPANNFDVLVYSKTKGSPYRHEVQYIPSDLHKKALAWPGQSGYVHFPKSAKQASQEYYPQPPKTVIPNLTLRPKSASLSERTANMLRNLEKSLWFTTYKHNFTGAGPMNPLQLDDYHEKIIGNVTGDPNLYSADPIECFQSSFSEERPLEGRISRLFQGRRPIDPITTDEKSTFHKEKNYASLLSDAHTTYASQNGYIKQDLTPNNANVTALKNQNLQEIMPEEENTDRHSTRLVNFTSSSDPLVLRNKTEQLQVNYYPGTFYEHLGHLDSCDNEPTQANSESHILKITDTKKTDALYMRQFQIRPRSAESNILEQRNASGSICYEDLPLKRLEPQNSWPYPLNYSKTIAPVKVSLANNLNKDSETQVLSQQCTVQEEEQHYPQHFEYGRIWSSGIPQMKFTKVPQTPTALRELQDSFSKSEAHKHFHKSVEGEAIDLRDNIHTGKKHSFFGFNAYYFRN